MNKVNYAKEFHTAASQIDKKLLAQKQLKVWVGTFQECDVLKIYKQSWANPNEDPITSPSRIFFSIWVDPAKEEKLLYNIHALKLRQLKGYKVESRKFAEVFRREFKAFAHDWENVNINHGPLTLMQGFVTPESKDLKNAVLKLTGHFLKIQHLIDQSLGQFRL